ncbi:MAG: hypothetical protein IJ735_01640 [Clostridia bacterium]|nr:hypothetical protein [Clostridia bacterium]
MAVVLFALFAGLDGGIFRVKQTAAYALDFPYVVVGQNVWLLKKEGGSRLFLLPETYYARVDNLDEEYYYVTFNGVSGKVDRTAVSSIGYHAEAPGTICELRVDPKYASFTEIRLKGSMDGGFSDSTAPVGGSFLFLGKYPVDTELWYYVRYEDVCGYIKAEFTTTPNITFPAFVPEPKPETDDPSPTTADHSPDESSPDLVKILVITGLSVAAVVLLIVLFRPRKKGAKRYYYEDVGDR